MGKKFLSSLVGKKNQTEMNSWYRFCIWCTWLLACFHCEAQPTNFNITFGNAVVSPSNDQLSLNITAPFLDSTWSNMNLNFSGVFSSCVTNPKGDAQTTVSICGDAFSFNRTFTNANPVGCAGPLQSTLYLQGTLSNVGNMNKTIVSNASWWGHLYLTLFQVQIISLGPESTILNSLLPCFHTRLLLPLPAALDLLSCGPCCTCNVSTTMDVGIAYNTSQVAVNLGPLSPILMTNFTILTNLTINATLPNNTIWCSVPNDQQPARNWTNYWISLSLTGYSTCSLTTTWRALQLTTLRNVTDLQNNIPRTDQDLQACDSLASGYLTGAPSFDQLVALASVPSNLTQYPVNPTGALYQSSITQMWIQGRMRSMAIDSIVVNLLTDFTRCNAINVIQNVNGTFFGFSITRALLLPYHFQTNTSGGISVFSHSFLFNLNATLSAFTLIQSPNFIPTTVTMSASPIITPPNVSFIQTNTVSNVWLCNGANQGRLSFTFQFTFGNNLDPLGHMIGIPTASAISPVVLTNLVQTLPMGGCYGFPNLTVPFAPIVGLPFCNVNQGTCSQEVTLSTSCMTLTPTCDTFYNTCPVGQALNLSTNVLTSSYGMYAFAYTVSYCPAPSTVTNTWSNQALCQTIVTATPQQVIVTTEVPACPLTPTSLYLPPLPIGSQLIANNLNGLNSTWSPPLNAQGLPQYQGSSTIFLMAYNANFQNSLLLGINSIIICKGLISDLQNYMASNPQGTCINQNNLVGTLVWSNYQQTNACGGQPCLLSSNTPKTAASALSNPNFPNLNVPGVDAFGIQVTMINQLLGFLDTGNWGFMMELIVDQQARPRASPQNLMVYSSKQHRFLQASPPPPAFLQQNGALLLSIPTPTTHPSNPWPWIISVIVIIVILLLTIVIIYRQRLHILSIHSRFMLHLHKHEPESTQMAALRQQQERVGHGFGF